MTFGSIGYTKEINTLYIIIYYVYNVYINMGISVPMQKQLKPWMRWKVRRQTFTARISLLSSLDAYCPESGSLNRHFKFLIDGYPLVISSIAVENGRVETMHLPIQNGDVP